LGSPSVIPMTVARQGRALAGASIVRAASSEAVTPPHEMTVAHGEQATRRASRATWEW
jgi:hypothetical protein